MAGRGAKVVRGFKKGRLRSAGFKGGLCVHVCGVYACADIKRVPCEENT